MIDRSFEQPVEKEYVCHTCDYRFYGYKKNGLIVVSNSCPSCGTDIDWSSFEALFDEETVTSDI